jgi:O-antigen/teichoic acid export membrane protein
VDGQRADTVVAEGEAPSLGDGVPAGAGEGVGRSSALLFAVQVAGNSGLFVSTLLLARALGPSGRGTMAFMMVSAMILARLALLGIEDASSVFAARRSRLRPAVLTDLLLFQLIGPPLVATLAVAGLAVSGLQPDGVGTPELLAIVLATTATAAALAGYAFLVGCGAFGRLALVTALTPWLYAIAVGLAWALVGLTVIGAAVLWILAQAGWATAVLVEGGRIAGLGRPSVPLVRELLAFGVRAWAGSLFRFLNVRVDQLLIAFLATEATLGTYAVAVNASEVILYLPSAASAALLPVVARSGLVEGSARVLGIFRQVLLVTVAGIAVSAAVGPLLIPLVFGDSFSGSVQPFLWLLPGAIGYTALSIFSNSLLASRAPGMSSLGSVTALGAGLALDIALIPSFGASGAAAAASAAFLAGGATAAAAYRSTAGFRWRDAVPTGEDVAFLRRVAERALRRGEDPA